MVVRDHFIRIFKEPSRQAAGIGEAVIGSRLMAAAEENGWYRISLPGNRTGWAEKKHFTPFPSATPENILALAKEFIGYQYLWGGRTPRDLTAPVLYRQFLVFSVSSCQGIPGSSRKTICCRTTFRMQNPGICFSLEKPLTK